MFPYSIFLYAAFNDANRRNALMKSLSNSLEIDFNKKDSVSIRLPTINFFDPQSLQSWLEARKVVLDIGSRFQIRMMFYVSTCIIIAALMIALIFAVEMGFIHKELMNTEQWILFWVNTAILTLACFTILLPSSYINKQTQYQMKRLIFIKEVYQRIVRDQRILRSNPNTLETKFTRLAIKMLRNATKDEDPKERFDKMGEIAN